MAAQLSTHTEVEPPMRLLIFLLVQLTATNLLQAKPGDYNPSLSIGKVETQLTSFSYNDREVPLKLYLPETNKTANKAANRSPVILLSHGLGGSREVGAYLGTHWAGRGFVVVAMQHPGSDDSVWKKVPPSQRLKVMKTAANSATFFDRIRDVPATINQLEKWAADPQNILYGRMNLEKIGMAGHSYGAITTQALCGQAFGVAGPRFADKRIDAGLPLSPSKPKRGDAKNAFGNIQMPMMLMTGTKDHSAIGNATPESRREVYTALPAGSKYELVLKDAQHMAFSDRTLLGKDQRNPNHHRVIKALSTAFWEAYLKENNSAKTWLEGKKPVGLLAPVDLWNRK